MNGGNEWGLLRTTGGGIMGVHSLSEAAPLKIAGFATPDTSFEGATKYSDWVFSYRLRRQLGVNGTIIDSSKDKGTFKQ